MTAISIVVCVLCTTANVLMFLAEPSPLGLAAVAATALLTLYVALPARSSS